MELDKIRFAVCSPDGRHSGVWFAWASKGDFYIGARSILASQKVSLHQPDFCQLAFTAEQFRRQPPIVPRQRQIVQWQRAPTPATGAIHVISLIFPLKFLRLPQPVGAKRKPVIIFEASGDKNAVEFGFFYAKEVASTLRIKISQIGRPLFMTALESGEQVWIVARVVPFDESVLPKSFEDIKPFLLLREADAIPSNGRKEGLTMALWNHPPHHGTLQMVEIGGVTLQHRTP